MDLTKVPELSGSRLDATKKILSALGLVISDLGASAVMHETGAARETGAGRGPPVHRSRARDGREVRPHVRRQDRSGRASRRGFRPRDRGLSQMAAHAKPAGVTVLMESHGDFTHSKDIAADADRGRVRCVRTAVGRASHIRAPGHEQPADTYAALGRWVRHTHLKDSIARGRRAALRADRHRRCPGEITGPDPRDRPATRDITVSSGRRSGTRKSRNPRWRSRTMLGRWLSISKRLE